MRLEKALDILYGELVNTPFISAFSGVTYNVKKVVSGTLFFALNPDDIKRAIANGAYGIVFEGDMVCSDDTEIAWIKCEALTRACGDLCAISFWNLNIRSLCLHPLKYL